MGAASQSNQKQMEDERNKRAESKEVGEVAGKKEWFCTECGAKNSGNFCSECGTKRATKASCSNCGYTPEGELPKFCPECGNKF